MCTTILTLNVGSHDMYAFMHAKYNHKFATCAVECCYVADETVLRSLQLQHANIYTKFIYTMYGASWRDSMHIYATHVAVSGQQ